VAKLGIRLYLAPLDRVRTCSVMFQTSSEALGAAVGSVPASKRGS